MTEQEYIDVTNITHLRDATRIIRSLHPQSDKHRKMIAVTLTALDGWTNALSHSLDDNLDRNADQLFDGR